MLYSWVTCIWNFVLQTDIEYIDRCVNQGLSNGGCYNRLSDCVKYAVHRHQPRISEQVAVWIHTICQDMLFRVACFHYVRTNVYLQEEGLEDRGCEVATSAVIVSTANIGLPHCRSLVMPPRTMSIVGWESGKCELLEIPRGHKTPCLPLPPGVDCVSNASIQITEPF